MTPGRPMATERKEKPRNLLFIFFIFYISLYVSFVSGGRLCMVVYWRRKCEDVEVGGKSRSS